MLVELKDLKMKCIWCDFETTPDKNKATDILKFANAEHIIPEAVGGVRCLEIGKVCMECNAKLGNSVDRYLKAENDMMMHQYQISSEIMGPIGKTEGKKRRERKLSEMKNLSGYSGGFEIIRDAKTNSTEFINAPGGMVFGDVSYRQNFSRALHKCALNIIQHEYDYLYVKSNHSELIKLIKDANYLLPIAWSYAVCYRHMFARIHFEPFWFSYMSATHEVLAVILVFPGAIFIVGSKPNMIEPNLLESIEKVIPDNLGVPSDYFDALNHFDHESPYGRMQYGQRFKFTFIKKEIQGEPNPSDAFYLLTKCWTCGQTSPTGILLGKEVIFNGNLSHTTSDYKNSWNRYTPEDFSRKGMVLDAWSDESIREYIETQAISYPAENDVKKMNIKDCSTKCINCGWPIEYSAKDCFL